MLYGNTNHDRWDSLHVSLYLNWGLCVFVMKKLIKDRSVDVHEVTIIGKKSKLSEPPLTRHAVDIQVLVGTNNTLVQQDLSINSSL